MINNHAITEAIAATLAQIPDLAAAMTVTDASQNAVVRITAFHYMLGQENQLQRAVYEMPAPSMLVAWRADVPSGPDGGIFVRHRFEIHCRMGNAAGQEDPVGYEELWNLFCSQPPSGAPRSIRYINLYPGLEIMDTPSCVTAVDEDGIDRLVITLVIPEIGDQ